MSAWFVAASSQKLSKTTPIAAVPWTIGLWVFPLNTTSQELVTINVPSTDANYAIEGIKDTVFHFGFAGAGSNEVTAGTVTIGAWHFVLYRAIANNNRRISVLNANGSVSHAQSTVNLTPAGPTVMTIAGWGGISGGGFLDGGIAEFWMTNTDVFPGGGAATDDFIRQLAYGGPFSLTSVANNLVEYLSFKTLPGRGSTGEDWYTGNRAMLEWTYGNTPVNGPHPPLPSTYKSPRDRQVVLPI